MSVLLFHQMYCYVQICIISNVLISIISYRVCQYFVITVSGHRSHTHTYENVIELRKQKIKTILLINNCLLPKGVKFDEHYLYFLSPNSTTVLQPLHHGFKWQNWYLLTFVDYIKIKCSTKITVLDVNGIMQIVQEMIMPRYIKNCFIKSGWCC